MANVVTVDKIIVTELVISKITFECLEERISAINSSDYIEREYKY
jgi:hypothetical protein